MKSSKSGRQAWDQRDSMTIRIVSAVAEAEDTRPCLLAPLGDVIDPDALEQLVHGADRLDNISFGYGNWTVSIGPDGTIELVEA